MEARTSVTICSMRFRCNLAFALTSNTFNPERGILLSKILHSSCILSLGEKEFFFKTSLSLLKKISIDTKRLVKIPPPSSPLGTDTKTDRGDRLAATLRNLPLFLPPWRSVVRSPRLFHEAFVRSIMNSVSFVEGGSFLLAPSKLRSLHRRREGSERKGHGDQGGNL